MADLYDEDLLLWSEEQARALRSAAHSGANLPIDWENVAEEIESLGKSLARELASRVSTILIHLMKLEASPAAEPRIGWAETIREQRDQIDTLAAVLARPLRYEPLSDGQARLEMAADASAPFIDAFFRFYSDGEFDDSPVLDTVQQITGHPSRRFEQWARAHAQAFK